MKNISKFVDFYIDKKHSNKKNIDFYPLILKIKDTEIFIGFLTKDQYELLSSTLN